MALPQHRRPIGHGFELPVSAPIWLKMTDEDQNRFGGPEWVCFDMAKWYRTPASQLEAFEMEMGFSIAVLISEWYRYSARSTRGAMWIARWLAGVKDERYKDFDPATIGVFRSAVDPAKPPAESNGNGALGKGRPARSRAGSKAAASPKS